MTPRNEHVTDAAAAGPNGIKGAFAFHDPMRCRAAGDVLARVGDKWSVLVVVVLDDGTLRFNELKRRIGSISQRMLTRTLRGLERDGLVTRKMFPTIPPRVDYALTPLGLSLRAPVSALGDWSVDNHAEIETARQDYDARAGESGAMTTAGFEIVGSTPR